jgi:hypothetical protein
MRMLMSMSVGMRMTMRMKVAVCYRMLVLMREPLRNVNIKFRAGDPLLRGASNVNVVALYLQLAQFLFQSVRVHTQIQQSAHKHVAADSTKQVQIKLLHNPELSQAGVPSARAFIWLAAYPAPNPLSMLTTVMPLEQLFNIPNNAAKPPKLAP